MCSHKYGSYGMARQTTQFSATEVKNAKPKDKEYYLVDGQGLKFRVLPSGSKQWLLNYYRPTNKKRANFSLGRYPEISLVLARKSALEARELIAQGIAPQEDKKRKEEEHNAIYVHAFFNVAQE